MSSTIFEDKQFIQKLCNMTKDNYRVSYDKNEILFTHIVEPYQFIKLKKIDKCNLSFSFPLKKRYNYVTKLNYLENVQSTKLYIVKTIRSLQ